MTSFSESDFGQKEEENDYDCSDYDSQSEQDKVSDHSSASTDCFDMKLAVKRKMEFFGSNFATFPLNEGGPWKACYDAVCKTDCHFMKFSKKALERILARIDNKKLISDCKFLKTNK